MLKKALLVVFCSTFSIFAYSGSLHSKYIEKVPEVLDHHQSSLLKAETKNIVKQNMELMKDGCQSPDRDHPELKIPDEWLPESLRKYNTSVAKWEHTLPNDVPKEIESILQKACKEVLKKDFLYADKTIKLWYDSAKVLWKENKKEEALYKLARCCHLIQDLTVPMHCKVSSGLIDAWNTLRDEEPNHEKFERLATEVYKPNTHDYKISSIEDLEKEMNEIAEKSRKIFRLCDQVGYTWMTRCILTKWITVIIPILKEDYEKALKISTQRGEEMTIRLIVQFFTDVHATN